jgi:hypothetical protein
MALNYDQRNAQDKLTRQTLVTLAPAIAKALGPAWKCEAPVNHDASLDGPLPSWYSLLGPEGEDIFIGTEWDNKTKLHVSGQFHDREDGHQFWYLPYGTNRPSIGVSASKSADAIAAEIRRRLFPDYVPLLVSCNEARQRFLIQRDTAKEVAGDLAAFIGAPLVDNVNDRDKTERKVNIYRSEALAGASFDLKVTGRSASPATIRFDHLDVPAHVAREILAVLVAHHVKEED